MRFQREMAGVEEVHLGARVVALECLGPRRQKERIILSPDCEQGRPLGAEIFLELGIESDVAGVIQEEVELNFVVTRPRSHPHRPGWCWQHARSGIFRRSFWQA